MKQKNLMGPLQVRLTHIHDEPALRPQALDSMESSARAFLRGYRHQCTRAKGKHRELRTKGWMAETKSMGPEGPKVDVTAAAECIRDPCWYARANLLDGRHDSPAVD